MLLQGQFPIRLFQFFLSGTGSDPHNIIVSGFFHHFRQLVGGLKPVLGEQEGACCCQIVFIFKEFSVAMEATSNNHDNSPHLYSSSLSTFLHIVYMFG